MRYQYIRNKNDLRKRLKVSRALDRQILKGLRSGLCLGLVPVLNNYDFAINKKF